MIHILIVDDHGIVRSGLRLLLEDVPDMEIIGEAVDGRQAVQLAQQLQPDVIVMDIGMPLLNGMDAAAQIIRSNDKTGIIALSMHFDESYVLKALDAGVRGYLLKDNADEDIERAIRAVAGGGSFFSPGIAEILRQSHVRLMKERHLQNSYDLLTEREREVLQLLAEGKSNKDVANLLNLSPYTVEAHRANLMRKLGLHNTADIVMYAIRKAIITP